MESNKSINDGLIPENKDSSELLDMNALQEVSSDEEKMVPITTTGQKVKKEYRPNMLIINSYWIELISKICFYIYLGTYELIGYFIFSALSSLLKGQIKDGFTSISGLYKEIGLKWLFISAIGQHLSIGFFCLLNFARILNETKSPIKFLITKFIFCIIFYFISIFFMKIIIEEAIFNTFISKINDESDISVETKEKIVNLINRLKILVFRIVGNVFGNMNNSLDRLLIGCIYISLFSTIENRNKKKVLFIRFLSIIPITYIIIGLIFRALNNAGIIILSPWVSQLFVGPKCTVFGFFIALLVYIKFKGKKYHIFDDDISKELTPYAFATISCRIFGIFGLIELFIGLIIPEISVYGFGNHYLLILCAPIMLLYDYKKKFEIRIKACKICNFACLINFFVSLISIIVLLSFGLLFFTYAFELFEKYIEPLIDFIQDNYEIILRVIDQFNLIPFS